MTEQLPDWILNGAKARVLATFNDPQHHARMRELRQAIAAEAIRPGTVVIYTGSYADHHGPAVYIGPSGEYPAGEETRYTLIFCGLSKLDGVGRGSFAVAGFDDQVPDDVRELAAAIARISHRTQES